MRFFVTNRHNGKRYPAEGQHWPEHGWYIKIYDFDPNAWGRAEDGIGPGPVMEQGWKPEMERLGYDFPPLTQPVNVRDQEMKRLAGSLIGKPAALAPCPLCKGAGSTSGVQCPMCRGRGTAPDAPPASPAPPATESKIDWSKRLAALRKRRGEPVAESIVTRLLEDCVPGGSAKGERHDTRGIDPKELAKGRKVEREHTKGAPDAKRAAEEIAIDHLSEPGHRNYYSRLAKSGLADELK